jgi:hypothetical protein
MVEMEEIEVLKFADLPDSMMTKITITDLLLSREGMAVVAKVEDLEITSIMTKIPTMPQGLDRSSREETTVMVVSSLLVVPSQKEADIETGLKKTTMIDHLLADSNLRLETLLESNPISMMTPRRTPEVEEVAVAANAVGTEAEEALQEMGTVVEEAVNSNITSIMHDERYKVPK